jgi:hypothetical protein
LHLRLRRKYPRGSSLAVAFAPASLGMTEVEMIAEIAIIARHRVIGTSEALPPIRLRSGQATDTKEHEGILEKMPCICIYAAQILGVPLSPSRALRHRSE